MSLICHFFSLLLRNNTFIFLPASARILSPLYWIHSIRVKQDTIGTIFIRYPLTLNASPFHSNLPVFLSNKDLAVAMWGWHSFAGHKFSSQSFCQSFPKLIFKQRHAFLNSIVVAEGLLKAGKTTSFILPTHLFSIIDICAEKSWKFYWDDKTKVSSAWREFHCQCWT